MPAAGEGIAAAQQAVSRLLPLAVRASGGMRPGEDRAGYLARVRQLAVDLWLETSAESETVRRIAELAACRTFTGVLLGVRIEPSTTRGVLTLRTWGPDGERHEEIRTDRTDEARGVQALELARGLVGHRVAVYKLEEPGRGRQLRYRCAKHLVDLGPDGGAAAAEQPDQPDQPARPRSPEPAAPISRERAGSPPAAAPEHAAAPEPTIPPHPAGSRRPSRRRATGHPAPQAPPPPAAQRTGPAAIPAGEIRRELLDTLDRDIGGDGEYQRAAVDGIMRRASTDAEGRVSNAALLRMLAARTPRPDTAAGQKILADYRASAPAG